MSKLLKTLSLVALGCLVISSAQAEFYLRPRAGTTISLDDGNSAMSLGATLGYTILPFAAVEGSYARLFGLSSNPDGHAVRGNFILKAPTGLIAPYASVGAGWLNWDVPGGGSVSRSMGLIGGGLSIGKIAFLSATVGAEYAFVNEGADLFEPYLSLGVRF